MSDAGFIIAPVTAEVRRDIRYIVTEKRLEMAIRFGRTDALALNSARGLAGVNFRTMKQALTWIKAQ